MSEFTGHNEHTSLHHIDEGDLLNKLLNVKSMADQGYVMASPSASPNGKKIKRVGSSIEEETIAHAGSGNYLNMTANQYKAFQKYPALIDALGTSEGESLVKEIVAKLNSKWVVKIAANSKEINPAAASCVTAGKNIKQFFVPEDKSWAACVIASGPFSADDAIVYDREEDRARILRKIDDDYEDITSQFNVVHEFEERNGE